MQLIKVAAAELNQTPLAWDSNKAHILAAIAAARFEHVSLLCLPELCITGYGCEDAFHAAGTWQTAWKMLQEILPSTRGMIVSLGMPLFFQHALYNVACLAADGRILGFTAKRFLAGEGIHYEPRWFKPWPVGRRAEVTLDGATYPLGDLHYSCGGVKIGFEICEDAWVANRPGAELALAGVDVILNPSASHFAFGKVDIRRRFVLEGSRAFGVTYVYSNLLGNEAGRAIYDGGAMIATGGKIVAAGPRFSFADHRLTTAVVDLDATRMNQARTASFTPATHVDADACIRTEFQFPQQQPEAVRLDQPAWETGTHTKQEEFTRAIALGLYDYLRKSFSHGFVVSLSGGADSAAVACLVAAMVKLGVAELGRERFFAKLSYLRDIPTGNNDKDIVRRLLSCVYQSTRNSSTTTREAARGVAQAVGAEFFEFDVEPIVQSYVEIVSLSLERELSWETDDIALQNIQARARAPSVWLLANIKGALLLATSNRSEAAVGYTTMDGDTCGGLSPIAGIDKAFLREWLRWMEQTGASGLAPIPALAAVNRQAPTAELRPGATQTDEADLMPYELLDAIERAAIRDKQSPLDIYKLMHGQFPQYSKEQLGQWIERFFRLWCRNQWKRERYAPSFHLDDENLDPKTWCRFPILSGGFERELTELRAYLASE